MNLDLTKNWKTYKQILKAMLRFLKKKPQLGKTDLF